MADLGVNVPHDYLRQARAVLYPRPTTTAGDNLAPVLSAADFTYLGAFYPPAPGSYNVDGAQANITVRNVGGIDYLYAFDASSFVQEFVAPSDANLATSPPFSTGTNTQVFGDIYGTNIYSHAGGPAVAPDSTGLAQNAVPIGISWVEADGKMYWTRYVVYETTNTDYDTGIGRGTINRSDGSSISEGMWALAYRSNHNIPNDPIDDTLVNVGNRWITGVVSIPRWFQAYTQGRRLAAGWGSPSISTANQGPISYGLSLYAFDPDVLGATPHLGVLGGANLTKLAAFPAGLTGNKRTSHGGVLTYQVYDWAHGNTLIDPSTDKMVWTDVSGVGGAWIDGVNRQGVVVAYFVTAGTMSATILSQSAYNVFVVDNLGDTQVGDQIELQTVQSLSNPAYAWATGIVGGISGNQITIDPSFYIVADYGGAGGGAISPSDIPLVGGWAHSGAQYPGGRIEGHTVYAVLYIYDPSHLREVTQGSRLASDVQPLSLMQLPLAGISQPFTIQTTNRSGTGLAMAYSPVTRRLYVWTRQLYHRGVNDNPAQVHVYQVAA